MKKTLLCASILTLLSPMTFAMKPDKFGFAPYGGFKSIQFGKCTDSTQSLLSGLDADDLNAQGVCAAFVQPIIGASVYASMNQFRIRASIDTGSSDTRTLLAATAGGTNATLSVKPTHRFSGDILYKRGSASGGLRLSRTADDIIVTDTTNNVTVTRNEAIYWWGPVMSVSANYHDFSITSNFAYLMADVPQSDADTTDADLPRRAFDKSTRSTMYSATLSLGYKKPVSNA